MNKKTVASLLCTLALFNVSLSSASGVNNDILDIPDRNSKETEHFYEGDDIKEMVCTGKHKKRGKSKKGGKHK